MRATGDRVLRRPGVRGEWWAALLLRLAIALAVAGLIELGRKLTGNETKISEKREELKET